MDSKENSTTVMSIFPIPPQSTILKVSVHIEFISPNVPCETSRPSTTARSLDGTVTSHPDRASSEPYPPTEKVPGSNPGGAVFASGSWVTTIHTIPTTISVLSGGKSKSKSDADDGSSQGSSSPALDTSYTLRQYLSEEPKQVPWYLRQASNEGGHTKGRFL